MTAVLPEALITAPFISSHAAYKLLCVKMWCVIYFNQRRTNSFRRQEGSVAGLEFVCRSWMVLEQLLWRGCPKWLTAGPHHWPQRKGKLTLCSQVSLWQSWRWIFPRIVRYRGCLCANPPTSPICAHLEPSGSSHGPGAIPWNTKIFSSGCWRIQPLFSP